MATAVDHWWIDLDAADTSEASLSADERERAGRLRLDIGRRRFVAGRAALRRILADHLGCSPAQVALAVGPHGKPALVGGELHFNLSNTGGVALIAISRDRAIGVDCEAIDTDRDDMRGAVEPFLSPLERATLAGEAAERERVLLHRLWTRKEALAKAIGLGLSLPLDAVTVLPGGDQVVALPGHGSFRLLDIPAPPGIVAAACGAGPLPVNMAARHNPAMPVA